MDWTEIYAESDIDEAGALFNFQFLQLINKHMPLKRIRCRTSQSQWVTSEFLSLIDKREYQAKLSSKLYKKCPCQQHLILKKESAKACNRMKLALKRDYVRRTLEKYKSNPKKLWQNIREFWPNSKKSGKKISKILNYSDEESIANCLNDHFADVATNLTNSIPVGDSNVELLDPQFNLPIFEFKQITAIDIANAISRLGPSKASFEDGITAYMVKCCKCEVLPVLTYIFNLSLTSKTFPSMWKSATLHPYISQEHPMTQIITIPSVFSQPWENC